VKLKVKQEKDIEQLRRIAMALESHVTHLTSALREAHAKLAKFTGKDSTVALQQTLAEIAEFEAKLREQAAQAPADEPAKPEPEVKQPKKREQYGATPQPSLPKEEQLFVLDDADQVCPQCSKLLMPLEGQFDESEMIDVVEVSYCIKQVKQQKYVCKCGGCVETAPGPERVTPGSRYSLDFAIKVATDKYLDHLPLDRQVRIMKRHGLVVTSQTLWDVLYMLGKRLESASQALMSAILSRGVIGLDQTSWKRLDGSKGTPWQLWVVTAPGLVAHRIRDDKSADTTIELLEGFEGTIICDAAATHGAGLQPKQKLAGCWAHVFRKFEDAAKDHPQATYALAAIGKLYEIDAKAEGDEARLGLRQAESSLVLAALKTWLQTQAVLRSTSIGKAVTYALDNWERLNVFVQDARVFLDNNATERAIRGPVVGRKNHFGSRSERGTEVASLFYSLLESAKLAGVDPSAYLHAAAVAGANKTALLPSQFAQAK
jgi:transposase